MPAPTGALISRYAGGSMANNSTEFEYIRNMKKISILIILFVGFSLCFSQTKQDSAEPPTTYVNTADTKPEYPGGIAAFRIFVMGQLDLGVISSLNGNLKSEARFLIDSKGQISSVTANGEHEDFNKEVIRAISTSTRKWKPATYKNQPVDYWYTTPISINLD